MLIIKTQNITMSKTEHTIYGPKNLLLPKNLLFKILAI